MQPNPFRTVWTQPRATIRAVVSQNPDYGVIPLACALGIVSVLGRASERNVGDKVSFVVILVLALGFGWIGGILRVWVTSHLVRLTGRWLKGGGGYREIRSAVAWGYAWSLPVLGIWIFQLSFFGSEMFTAETPSIENNTARALVMTVTAFAQLALSLLSIFTISIMLAEVQGYASAWRGFLNLLLAGAVILVPLVVIVLLVVFLTRS